MSFTVRCDGNVILLDFAGVVTRRELLDAMLELGRIESALTMVPDRIIDLTQVSSCDIRYPAVSDQADSRRTRTHANPYRAAIVAKEPVAYGLARMFEALQDSPHIALRIFADRPAAEAWIAAPR